jgi:NAD(P)-dependent dehydrogenase (short-subunit alcohol dehydrogenase family)
MPTKMLPQWNLIICAIGTLKPVGKFFEQEWGSWKAGFESNVLEPLRLVHELYPFRQENPTIVFFGGTNPYKSNANYSGYASAKAALRMMTRDIAAEYEDLKVVLMDTGFVQTKIHKPTIEAGVKNERLEMGGGTTHDEIYTVLNKLLKADKRKVSGHPFFVPNCCK